MLLSEISEKYKFEYYSPLSLLFCTLVAAQSSMPQSIIFINVTFLLQQQKRIFFLFPLQKKKKTDRIYLISFLLLSCIFLHLVRKIIFRDFQFAKAYLKTAGEKYSLTPEQKILNSNNYFLRVARSSILNNAC